MKKLLLVTLVAFIASCTQQNSPIPNGPIVNTGTFTATWDGNTTSCLNHHIYYITSYQNFTNDSSYWLHFIDAQSNSIFFMFKKDLTQLEPYKQKLSNIDTSNGKLSFTCKAWDIFNTNDTVVFQANNITRKLTP